MPMIVAKLVTVLRKVTSPRGRGELAGLLSAEQVRRLLEKERTRTDRTGDKLSVLTFTPRNEEADRATSLCLARILKKRLRCTDDVGWLDGQQICVVLPSTPPAGAWRVADDVCLRFPDHLPPPVCTVYSYPSGEWEGPAGQNGTLADAPEKPALALEILFLQPTPLWKRMIDLAGAAVALVLLLPVWALIAVSVKLSSPGPVLFRQLRTGRGGKPFLMYKFRTMVADAEAKKSALLALNEQDGPAFKIKNDPRMTRLGRLLRKASLDELPQLINVLKGDMSLVGPRPLPCAEAEACSGWLRRRLDVTPGLTCIWQVRGRSMVRFDEWVRMDLQYIRSLSLLQDLKLLLMTVPALVLGKGAR